MIFTQEQTQEILNIIDFHHLFVIATNFGSQVLTDDDVSVIRNDFLVNYGRCHMEKVAESVIIFIVPSGYSHTVVWHLKNKPLPSQREGKEKLMELLDHIISVDDLQIILQHKVK